MKITSSINESGHLDIPKLPTPVEDETPTNIIILKPSEYEKITYSKYSLTELRSLCSHYNIKKSGTKTDLTQRIYTFLKQTYFIRRIQRKFKNFLSRKYGRLSGPGYLQSTKCVNDTDFYTFDKISNIKPPIVRVNTKINKIKIICRFLTVFLSKYIATIPAKKNININFAPI